jgi:hypothetical protein
MMLSPGYYSLGNFSITAADTASGDAVTGLEGMLAASVQLRFVYGSGGTNAKAYIQTSFDQGNTWVDVATVLFEQANETRLVNLSGLTPKTTQVTPTDGSLGDDTAVDGLLGDRVRVKVISTGTYAGSTTLSASVVAR